jgi:hypothetical protein
LRTGFRLRKRVPAFLFYLKKVAGRDRIEAALAEAVLVNAAGVLVSWGIFGILNQERTAEQDFAARPAARTFALSQGQEFLGLCFEQVRLEETPCLTDRLAYA